MHSFVQSHLFVCLVYTFPLICGCCLTLLFFTLCFLMSWTDYLALCGQRKKQGSSFVICVLRSVTIRRWSEWRTAGYAACEEWPGLCSGETTAEIHLQTEENIKSWLKEIEYWRMCGPRCLSRCSDLLRLDGSGSNPVGDEIFRTHEDRHWGPTSLLSSGYRVSFPGAKRPGRGLGHPLPSSAEVKEKVELHHYYRSAASWPVLGWISPFSIESV
jgi:hypothetical protein